jgi:RNA polymerase sigma-70 factor (ECF subfamily)
MMSDEQIIRAIKEGDRKGPIELVKKYQSRVSYFIYRFVCNIPDTEDLTMITLQKAITNINQYRPTHKFVTWLFNIARNTTVDYIRSQKYRIPLDIDVDLFKNKISVSDSNPERQLQSKEEVVYIEKCIDQLSDGRKELLRLHIDGYKNKDISEELGISNLAVRSKLCRLRQDLKVILGNEVYS